MSAGSLSLLAGNTSSTTASSVGGSITIAAGTVSATAANPFSFIHILGTNQLGTAGDIIIFSTGTVVVQSPLLATAPARFSSLFSNQLTVTSNSSLASAVAEDLLVLGSSSLASVTAEDLIVSGSSSLGTADAVQLTVFGSATIGTAASDTLIANAAVVAKSGMTVGGLFLASGNAQLGSSAGTSTLTVYAATVFTAAAGTITANAAFTANAVFTARAALVADAALTVNGDTTLGNTASRQTLTIHAETTFTAAAGLVIVDVPVYANSDMHVGGLLNASRDVIIGSDGQDSLTVNAEAMFTSLLSAAGKPLDRSLNCTASLEVATKLKLQPGFRDTASFEITVWLKLTATVAVTANYTCVAV